MFLSLQAQSTFKHETITENRQSLFQTVWELTPNKYGIGFLIFAQDPDMSMWISGFQVEKGNSPTDFQDDTVDPPVKPNAGI